jgi:hypothetical protein
MTKLFLSIALAAASVSSAACAQARAGDRAAAQQPDLTREEARARADQLFQQFDLNHDGIVTRAEAEQMGQQLMMQRARTGQNAAPGIGGHTLRFLKQTFATTQAVTMQQFEAAMLAHFDQMDINQDGVLTAQERAEAPAKP